MGLSDLSLLKKSRRKTKQILITKKSSWISPLYKQLQKQAILKLINPINALFRKKYVPEMWKVAACNLKTIRDIAFQNAETDNRRKELDSLT